MIRKWAWIASIENPIPVQKIVIGFQDIEQLFADAMNHAGVPKRMVTIDGQKKQVQLSGEEYERITNPFIIASACTFVSERYHISDAKYFFGLILQAIGYQKAGQKLALDASEYIVNFITSQIVENGVIDKTYKMVSITDYNEYLDDDDALSHTLDVLFAAAVTNSYVNKYRSDCQKAFHSMLEFKPKDSKADAIFMTEIFELIRDYTQELISE